MNTPTAEALSRIDRGLARLKRTEVLRHLQPGIRVSDIIARGTLGRDLDVGTDLIAIYAWHNGTDTTSSKRLGDIQLFPGFYFLSVEDSLANYNAFVKSPRWSAGWLPVFADGGGDFYALVCDRLDALFGSMLHFRYEESEHPVEYRSLGSMLDTIASAYDDGAYFVDEKGYLDVDDKRFAALASQRNPGVEWWA